MLIQMGSNMLGNSTQRIAKKVPKGESHSPFLKPTHVKATHHVKERRYL